MKQGETRGMREGRDAPGFVGWMPNIFKKLLKLMNQNKIHYLGPEIQSRRKGEKKISPLLLSLLAERDQV